MATQEPPQEETDYHLAPGQKYEGFEVMRRIGRGGFGEVYLVKDADGKRGALKLFVPIDKNDKKGAHRFLQEAQILKRMRPHTHLVRCDAHGQASDEKKSLWLLLEFLPGNTLRRELEISEAGRMPMERALRLGIQVAMALSHCHQYGLVHRDVKPENVMITPGDVAKLLDFGIAKANGVHLRTTRNVQLGTGLYMAPDRLVHQGDDASPLWDMYSLGVVMWELCTGHHPFHSRAGEALTDAEVIHKHMGHKIPSLAAETGYPEEVCAPIMRACAGTPRARFANMEELISALEKALRSWRDLSTERVNVLGKDVPAETRARIVQATTEPSIAFAIPGATEPAAAPEAGPSRWLKTEPIAVVQAREGSAVPFVPVETKVTAPVPVAAPVPAPAPVSPPALVPAPVPVPVLAPVPSPRVLHEIGRPPRTREEEALVSDLDAEEQAWRVLFLRYIDTLPPNAMIDSEATGQAIWAYLDALASRREANRAREAKHARDAKHAKDAPRVKAEGEGAGPPSRHMRRVPGWVLVLAGVLVGGSWRWRRRGWCFVRRRPCRRRWGAAAARRT